MDRRKAVKIQDVSLPFSNGTLSAQMWASGERVVVGVPEVGLHCYGKSQPEAVFRLFTVLLKYYRQLAANKEKLGKNGLKHLGLLRVWVESIERKLTAQPQLSLVKGRK